MVFLNIVMIDFVTQLLLGCVTHTCEVLTQIIHVLHVKLLVYTPATFFWSPIPHYLYETYLPRMPLIIIYIL